MHNSDETWYHHHLYNRVKNINVYIKENSNVF